MLILMMLVVVMMVMRERRRLCPQAWCLHSSIWATTCSWRCFFHPNENLVALFTTCSQIARTKVLFLQKICDRNSYHSFCPHSWPQKTYIPSKHILPANSLKIVSLNKNTIRDAGSPIPWNRQPQQPWLEDQRHFNFWEDQRAGGLKKRSQRSILGCFCFLRLEDQNRFQGPGGNTAPQTTHTAYAALWL